MAFSKFEARADVRPMSENISGLALRYELGTAMCSGERVVTVKRSSMYLGSSAVRYVAVDACDGNEMFDARDKDALCWLNDMFEEEED